MGGAYLGVQEAWEFLKGALSELVVPLMLLVVIVAFRIIRERTPCQAAVYRPRVRQRRRASMNRTISRSAQ
jgi:hypothetical protein